MSKAKSSNWDKAPESAKFVKGMRAVFGADVKVLYVKENDLLLGEPCDDGFELASATAFDVEGKKVLERKKAA